MRCWKSRRRRGRSHIAIDRIRNGRYQPRLDLRPEGLQELAETIWAQGVVQPVVVRPLGSSGDRMAQ